MPQLQVVHHKYNEITSPYKFRFNANWNYHVTASPGNSSIERERERMRAREMLFPSSMQQHGADHSGRAV
jgi:hypothetical protein